MKKSMPEEEVDELVIFAALFVLAVVLICVAGIGAIEFIRWMWPI